MSNPTTQQFGAYVAAFDYFNRELFGGELPPCFLNFSRLGRAYGFFATKRWRTSETEEGSELHEISLNPDNLDRPAKESLSTLVHEMAHLWQEQFGKPSAGAYHNMEWVRKMEAIGLIPSSTGEPGGKQTGTSVSHYIKENGPFDVAFRGIPESHLLPWTSGVGFGAVAKKPRKPRKDKVKYTCSGCNSNVWGKTGLRVSCSECEEDFEEQET